MATAEEVMYMDSLGAMRASLSSSTTKEQRILVENFLSQLKDDRRCLEVMTHVLTVHSENHDDNIRLLSLTILNDWLKIWWNKLSESEHASIRNTVIMLLNGHVGKSPARGLWTKLAVMISNIAVRQFPQMWPNFLEHMVSICLAAAGSSSFGEQEIAIMVIEFTASDSIDTDYSNSLPLQRRQDILAGFRKKLTELLGFSYSFLIQCSNRYAALPPKGTSGVDNDSLRAHLLRLMGGLMRMMVPLAMFAKVEDLCHSSRDFSVIAVQFLCEPELQSDSVEFLSIITRHKLPLDVFARLVEMIPRLSSPLLHPMPHTGTVGGGGSLSDDIYESLIFQRAYTEMVFSLLSENIVQATDKYYLEVTPRAQEILGTYVMLMANLVSQPSWRLAVDVTKEWTKIFREDSIKNIPWMSDVCAVVLNVYAVKLERIIWEKERAPMPDQDPINTVPVDETAAAEFENYDEWLDFSGAVKTQMMNLCAVMGPKYPLVCGAYLHTRALALLAMPPSVCVGDPNDADDVRQWQAFGTIFEVLSTDLLLPPTDPTDAGVGTGTVAGSIERRTVLEQLQEIVERILAWSPPPQSALQLQRLQCLQSCAPVLKVAPFDMLQRVYADLFRHDSPSFAPTTSPVSLMLLSEKATAVVAHLSHTCGEAAVSDATLLNAIVTQILNMIAVRKVQVPSTPSELKSLQNQRGCLRESLVALSERLCQKPAQQKELLVMSLADVVASWQEVSDSTGGGLFSSPQALLAGCFQNTPAVTACKDVLGVILSSSKRVTCAPLPDAVWVVDAPHTLVSVASLVPAVDRALPFLAVWQAVMPGMRWALKSFHGILDPSTRPTLPPSLFMPPASLVRRAVGVSHTPGQDESDGMKGPLAPPGVSDEAVVVGKHLGEIRMLLYQLLGQACSHRALYVCAEHSVIISELSVLLPWLENYQLSQLMKTFVESFVLNAPPVVYDIVAGFLDAFLNTTFRRLGVCWTDPTAGPSTDGLEALQRSIYRDCSLPPGFAALDANQIENARNSMCAEITRTYGDLLSSFACCRGFLALDMPTSAAHQSASMLGISTAVIDRGTGVGRGKKGKGKKPELKPLDPVAPELPSNADTDAQLKQHKTVRRKALNALLMGNPRYQGAVTAPFVASAVSLIGIPDTTVSRRGLTLASHLATRCREDRRLLSAVGKDAFSAALSVLLMQEAWSEGMEGDVIEFLATVYELLVFGETLGPDGSILTPPATAPKVSKPKEQGFGSMSGWQGGPGHQPAKIMGGKNNGNSIKTSSSGKDSSTMLSDLPRKVMLMVQSITPLMLEALETQMLGTTSKKKRRDYLKDMLKTAGIGGGSTTAAGKRVEAAVLDIRQRMAPKLGKKIMPGQSSSFGALGGAEDELNLSSFFGD